MHELGRHAFMPIANTAARAARRIGAAAAARRSANRPHRLRRGSDGVLAAPSPKRPPLMFIVPSEP